MIQSERIKTYNSKEFDGTGDYVLYWMQSAQRIKNNHALELSIQLSNKHNLPLLVCIIIMEHYPGANRRHYEFMIEGIQSLENELTERGISHTVQVGDVKTLMLDISKRASLVVFDDAITRPLKTMKEEVVKSIPKRVFAVETNVIVPIGTAYPKEAYAAYAIRKALQRQAAYFAIGFEPSEVKNKHIIEIVPHSVRLESLFMKQLSHLEELPTEKRIKGGEPEALEHLKNFVENGLEDYDRLSNHPETDATSHLSAYLHFGQLSPVTVYEEAMKSGKNAVSLIEQLFIRRELAYNFVHYNSNYDQALTKILPDWAIKELDRHRIDERPYIYALEALEQGTTHDPYWNAAQKEMVLTGFMHGTMRMYWGKKIIEWSKTPEIAFEAMLFLNDKYQLDGRDPNGYAGIAWCFGKHDRPFSERAIFGKVRYMNAEGLKRKYRIESYVDKIEKLEGQI
jgi:deoxyribodipyrimidine photo-lyase